MAQERELKLDCRVIVAGTGLGYEEKLQQALDVLGPADRRIFIDCNLGRLGGRHSQRVLADVRKPPLNFCQLAAEQRLEHIGLIATPDHLPALTALTEAGLRKFIVEKPLVNNQAEVEELKVLIKKYPGLMIYPLDFYVQKAAPLLILTGAISPLDPRWQWVQTESGEPVDPSLADSLQEMIGSIEGIEATILEGGQLGVPDLDKRRWLEVDPQQGGMLLDLGTHALTPLVAAGLISADRVSVDIAERYILGHDRYSFVRTTSSDHPEILAKSILSLKQNDRAVPIILTVGKTYHSGGMWELIIRGEEGDLVMGLRTGQKLTVIPKNGSIIELKLKSGSDPYKLAFQEADMCFRNSGLGTFMLKAMFDSIEIIEMIKSKANS